ncbi:MAG: family 78 glycoside hydrolase catalytic domain, partial [Victivallales bacterium]|nr:family 78 glycoside hydrolase catalytic domain [Victivallales bacterium]
AWPTCWGGWPAGWSGSAIYFRRIFTAPEKFRKGRLYLAASWAEVWLNGVRLGGDAVIQPAQSDYDFSYHYLTYDITAQLKPGENLLALHVGNGWAGIPRARFRLDIDGYIAALTTGNNCAMLAPSPIYRHSIYGGEEYDATRSRNPLWLTDTDGPSSARHEFKRAAVHVPGPNGTPRGLEEEPIRPQGEVAVASWRKLDGDGHYTADFGRNFAGWCRLKVKAARGTRIEMKFAECLYGDGRANQENLAGEDAVDVYIAAGTGDYEVFEPHFTYHGFRFVEISGLPGEPEADTLTGIILRTDCRPTGTFTCSNPLVNDIFTMIRHTEESNLHAVPTDCPQRTERMGWLNDMMARCESEMYLFDTSNLLTKWVRDIGEAQDKLTGDVPMTAPLYWQFDIDPVCSSFIEAPWFSYLFYGKKAPLQEHFGGMRRWVEWMMKCRDDDGILRRGGWVGDWVPPLKFNNGVETPQNLTVPHELVATAMMHYAAVLLSRVARILGRDADREWADAAAEKIRQDFRSVFRCAPGRLAPESQSAYAFAIYCGLLEESERPLAAARLAELFQGNGCKHTTGNIGTKYLLESLADYGYADLAFKLISSRDYPGWGYMLENGATTLWERWEKAEGGGMNSHNHPMLGCPCAWLFRYPAGIRITPEAAGFNRFVLDPVFITDLEHAEAEYASRAGLVKSAWKRTEGGIRYDFTVPPGCTASVRTPAGGFADYGEGSYTLTF